MKVFIIFQRLAAAATAAFALAYGMCCVAASPTNAPVNPAAAPIKTVRVDSAWVRAAPPGATMLAGYMTLHNDGKTPVRFTWAQSDAFGMVELHRSLIVNGIDTMRPAGDQIIPPEGSLRFEPGGLHLMLMQAQRDLKVGDQIHFRLHFADGTMLDVVAPVSAQAPAAKVH